MKTEFKKTISHAWIYTIGILLNRAISFVMLPLYTRYLSPKDYGVLELLEMTVEVLVIMTGMGIHNGLSRYYYRYDNEKDRDELVSTLIILVLAFYLTTSVVGISLSPWITALVFGTEEYTYLMMISFVNMFLQFILFISLAYYRTVQKPKVFITVNGIKLLIQLALNIVFIVFLGMGIAGILLSTLISTLFLGGWLLVDIFRKTRVSFSMEKAANLLRFGAPFVLAGYGAFILTFSDRYFINHYWDATQVGLYSLGYKFGFLLMVFPVSPFMNIWMVQRFELVRNGDCEKVFNKMLSWFTMISLSGALGLAVFSKDILALMSAPEFHGAYMIVPVVVFAYFLQACTDFFNFGIYHSGKTRYMAYATGLAVAAILPLSFILIPRWGLQGAAWATLAAFAVRLGYVYYASQKSFWIGYRTARPLFMTAMAVATYLAHLSFTTWAPSNGLLVSLAFDSAFFGLFPALLIATGCISRDEKDYIFTTLSAPFRKVADTRG